MTHALTPSITPHAGNERPGHLSLIDANVIRRAGIVAIVLGSVLTLANQPGAFFGQDAIKILPLVMVFLTPFIVVTISQVLGIRRALMDASPYPGPASHHGSFLTTAVSHGIPIRSFLVGLVVGITSTFIVAIATLLDGGTLADLPIALNVQAFVLPMLFGLISQAISYRRVASASTPKPQTA